ncbi:uncharacterized protein OCT59_022291 [Rhizophagus irregularis]|uniref:uncharacterized protein n=1 Tax=Rhizophagus irregularis TaxID=588596 RepID=UPI00331B0FB6|nr:hypothetical protein OCT59_022291 [Rhizophagus irregularis]
MSIHLQKFYFISRRGVNVITQRILLKEILGYKTFRFSSQISSSIFVTTRKNNTEIIIEDDAHYRKRIWSYLERGSGKDQRRITIVGRGETRMRTVDDIFILNLETDDKIAFWMIIN